MLFHKQHLILLLGVQFLNLKLLLCFHFEAFVLKMQLFYFYIALDQLF